MDLGGERGFRDSRERLRGYEGGKLQSKCGVGERGLGWIDT